VLNEKQTKDIFNTAKLTDKLINMMPRTIKTSNNDKLETARAIITNNTYGDINIKIENGDKKKARDIASEIMGALKKKGK